ncbi:hypothetical protein TUM4438_10120 [Shewanella sairae]|uniref:HTH cro/C1-type domain-containing protein n=1 Tax=Shewanella sairae TaxID=190310 RepID=A0ABQ4P6L5_9GAMM|nr:helix-turn-helix transcriptional regulator [Shewanella sairae]MCL1130446.1 helix-turn-helix domain-containing protein [Shewanella sairae]GIU42776.1 hypothetical protein TUM4438_10120 [Shewanella sairae]
MNVFTEYRKKNQLTQIELAEMLDLNQSMVSFLENGHRKLDPRKVKAVSKITGIPKHELRPDLYEE